MKTKVIHCPTCREMTYHIVLPENKSLAECTICYTKAGIKQGFRTPSTGNHKNKVLIETNNIEQ